MDGVEEKPKQKDAETDEDILEEARARFKIAEDAEQDYRREAREALAFCIGDQWPDAVKQLRESDRRPCLTLDKIGQYTRQILNDAKQSRPGIKIMPADSRASVETAEMLQDHVRAIEQNSRAWIAYDTALQHAVETGRGYIRVNTKYSDAKQSGGAQDIEIVRIRNRFSVYLDPLAQQPDGSDAGWGFVFEDMAEDTFEATWPDVEVSDFKSDADPEGWVTENTRRVAEYFRIAGDVCEWYLLTKNEILERTVIPCEYVLIARVVGNENDEDGKLITSGAVKAAMDPMRMYNYAGSAFVENVMLAPTAPWVGAAGQVEKFKDIWKDANRRNVSFLPYDPVDINGIAVPPPQRQEMPGMSAGWAAVMQKMESDIQAAFGMYGNSLGQSAQETAGVAIFQKRTEGDTSNFHFVDNLSTSVQHVGRIIVSLIGNIYKQPRIIQRRAEDGSVSLARISPMLQDSYMKVENGGQAAFNPTIGKFQTAVTTGPSFATKREQAADWTLRLLQADPTIMPLIGDVVFRNLDAPGSDEIAKRLKSRLPPELQGEDETPVPPALIKALQDGAAMMEQLQGENMELKRQLQDKSQASALESDTKLKIESIKQMNENRRQVLEIMANRELEIIKQAGAMESARVSNLDERAQQIRLALDNPEPGERMAALAELMDDMINNPPSETAEPTQPEQEPTNATE